MTETSRSTNLPLAYLRTFLILLVVAHHAALAYYPKAPPVPASLLDAPRWWLAFPVVDPGRFAGFEPFVQFNDTFFMAAMFLLSGLFVWKSIVRKQPAPFLRDRLLRLGLPFVLAGALGPLCYYPTYLQLPAHPGFWQEWLALRSWPAGPAWFLWVLLVFDIAAIAIFTLVPSTFLAISRKVGRQQPYGILAWVFALSAILYVPMLLRFGPFAFWIWGPFYFQTSRIFYYLVYFLTGVALGAGQQETILRADGPLAARWRQWVTAAVAGFVLLGATNYFAHHIYYPLLFWRSAVGVAFALSSALSCFGCLAFFLHFVRQRRPWLDSLFVCSYGIYLTHYALVSWTQFSLLGVAIPAWLKGGIVFSVASLLSWGLTAVARRSRLVASII